MKKLVYMCAILVIFLPLSVLAQSGSPWIEAGEECTEERAIDVKVYLKNADKLEHKNETANIPKKEGKKILCLKQEVPVRPYTDIQVIRQTTRGICTDVWYQVDGIDWGPWHPAWSEKYNLSNAKKTQHSSCSRPFAPYEPDPSAVKIAWKVFQKQYNYDETPPTCGQVRYFLDANGHREVKSYNGGWINQQMYVSVQCDDRLSQCATNQEIEKLDFRALIGRQLGYGRWQDVILPMVKSSIVPIAHLQDRVSVQFFDRAKNKTERLECLIHSTQKPYLYDSIIPSIESTNRNHVLANTLIEEEKDNTPGTPPSTVHMLAGEKNFQFTVKDDKKKDDNSDGISGIRSLRVSAIGNNRKDVCNYSRTFDENSVTTDKFGVSHNVEVACNFTKAGHYHFNLILSDHANNQIMRSKTIIVHPNNKVSLIVNPSDRDAKFANHSDIYNLQLSLQDEFGNPITGKNATFTKPNDIDLEEGSKQGGALDVDAQNILAKTNESGLLGNFRVSSYAPGTMSGSFQVSLAEWDEKYVDKGNVRVVPTKNPTEYEDGYKFLPLYKAEMLVEDNMLFGQEQEITFTFEKHNRAGNKPQNVQADVLKQVRTTPDDSWKMTATGGTIKPLPVNGVIVQKFIAEQLKKFTGETKIYAKPRIFYNLDGKKVSYHVGKDYTIPVEELDGNGASVNKIYIGGQEQSQGKQEFVSDMTKLGNNSWVTARNTIARSVAELTRNREANGSVVNGVKYVSGDYTLSGEVNGGEYKTLIIEGGNVTFDNNFNTKKENIAIIVMKKGDESKGNMYIKPNVAFISALIFTEGSIESVNEEGKPFTISDKERTQTLSKQIVFHGGLYSRNTIGGAVHGADGKYVLPGAVKTDDIHKAVRFDLSFLRMRSEGWDKDSHTKPYNQGRKESVIVWPNMQALSNPPPGFQVQ